MEKKLTDKTNSVFDIAKFILCLVIVSLHTWILPYYLYPFARLAVPLFFMISSYFFFSKINKCTDYEGEKAALKGFVKRNAQLYLFWFIALLPLTFKIREWFSGEVSTGTEIVRIIRSVLFASSFRASWFISALIIAGVVVFYASKLFGNRALLIISVLIYAAVCTRSSYYFLVKDIAFVNSFTEHYELVFTASFNSFPVALIWVVCGKCFADRTFSLKMLPSAVLLFFSLAALCAEWRLVYANGGDYDNDCWFMLLPASVAAFGVLQNIKPFTVRGSVTLRKISTVIYVLHATLASVLRELLKIKNNYIVFGVVLLLCLAVCSVIFSLEKLRTFRFLKYSH